MLLNLLAGQIWLLLLLLMLALMAAATNPPQKLMDDSKNVPLTWRQKEYYQKNWKQRMRFTTEALPGATTESDKLRKVYPCYCYKPPQSGAARTERYEKYMTESRDIFILNK